MKLASLIAPILAVILFMRKADLDASDLPPPELADYFVIKDFNGVWQARSQMAEEADQPLIYLQKLRGLGVYGQWSNEENIYLDLRKVPAEPNHGVIFWHERPNRLLSARYLFFSSKACAKAYVETEASGDLAPQSSNPAVELEKRYTSPKAGEKDVATVLASYTTVIVVTLEYQPGKLDSYPTNEPLKDPWYYEQFIPKPDTAALAERLATKFAQQLPGVE